MNRVTHEAYVVVHTRFMVGSASYVRQHRIAQVYKKASPTCWKYPNIVLLECSRLGTAQVPHPQR